MKTDEYAGRPSNPALQPFRTLIQVTVLNGQSFVSVAGPVVPAGKRLVIETVSIWGLGPDSDDFTGVWLNVVGANPVAFVLLDPNSTERRIVSPGTFVSAYATS